MAQSWSWRTRLATGHIDVIVCLEKEKLMNIHVGNISSRTAEDALRRLFEKFGEVSKTAILSGKFSGNESGVAFVEMPIRGEGEAAIHGLNGRTIDGQSLLVSEAKSHDRMSSPRSSGPRRGRKNDSW
jgi:RNA recognition motif-containing protein